YDEWAALGNTGWSWSKTMPRFVALEDDLDFDGEFHGRGGPFPIRRWRSDELTTVQQSFFDACLAVGFPFCPDHNYPGSTGVGPIPSNRRDAHTRVSTATAYFAEARARENLTILADALVSRVRIRDGKTCGVEVVAGSTVRQLHADRVILAAGAFCTPAILLRSGIGPEGDLRRLGVEVHAALSGVGSGLVDQ